MKLLSGLKNSKNLTEIFFVCLVIQFYFIRTSIPFLKYPFILLFLGIFVYSVINYRNHLFTTIKDFLIDYFLLIILLVVLVISFLISNKIYLSVFKDIISTTVLFFIFLIMKLIITKKIELSFFIHYFISLIIVFALLVSINVLGISFNIFSEAQAIPSSNSINGNLGIDINFALLPVFFGIISIFYFLIKPVSILRKGIFNLILIIYSISIFFSGSRRGFILLISVIILLFLIQIFSLFKKNSIIKTLSKTTLYYLISLIILSGLFYYFTFNTTYLFKSKTIEFIGSKNVAATKQKIAINLCRYSSIFAIKSSYDDFYNTIWSASLDPKDHNPSFDPKNPESIWGTRIHKTIFPLTGENVEIVPPGTKGYLMDSTCNADTWNGNAYSYTLIGKSLVNENDILKASVYCYVSKDFDGKWAIIYGSDAAYGQCDYDLKNKGTWQKLNLNSNCKKGKAFGFLYFSKFGVKDFSSLKGYVIFAYPEIEIIRYNNKSSSFNDNPSRKDNRNLYLNRNKLKNKGINETDPFINKIDWSVYSKYVSSGFFTSSIFIEKNFDSAITDKDPIRNWAARFISEDTTYFPFKANIVVDTISNSFIDPRILRWKFAMQIFLKEYSWKQKIFGGGFNFLNWYGYYFDRDKTRSDYPHNPFLSILLYSGIFGLMLYVIFMLKVFFYYIMYFKEYKIMSVFFIFTFFFSFFSAGSPFDPPIMGFFVILPFFIHHMHKKKSGETSL